ncbi:uncharacterized protein SCHCODRAFT_02116292 [Schizophyllum commune H4-8]|uniref:uncharacterized protein n=1 Tax=Schizophyllum commune (strain H4-8 / FGSC 9210) TaxID=578458 RepID=UPI00215DEA1A|nr:uncharacterized protein SCHCODRAFT_02116292 [Schizophyllum commune H4-8]KAI5886212.1 hypothetical protein SCHCODRAFT_02116292 [Schizophyllum commune H4-8]
MKMLDAEDAELAVDSRRASAAGRGGTGGAPRELIDVRAFVKLVFGVAYGVFDDDPEDDTLLCDGCGCRCELAPVPKVDVDGCLAARSFSTSDRRRPSSLSAGGSGTSSEGNGSSRRGSELALVVSREWRAPNSSTTELALESTEPRERYAAYWPPEARLSTEPLGRNQV